ncbi:Card1-like endonuclease domain-containing protein [Ekhidna sp.]|uniref:Card1-like endonuclease domain-containing protein n=1 Tax=Ekhidna sp. TaxID=2608089 RepID=UPI00351732AB
MKVIVTLVGGQSLPVYLGIKEFNPDKLVFLSSKDSKQKLTDIKSLLQGHSFHEFECDPFEFESVVKQCESIISKFKTDEIIFNLTGGTKIMVLAVQSIIQKLNLSGFYLNQDNSVLLIPAYKKQKITYSITIDEFFQLSGHKLTSFTEYKDISKTDIKVSHDILTWATNDNRYTTVTKHFRSKFKNTNHIPSSGDEKFGNAFHVKWDVNTVQIAQKNKSIISFKSSNIKSLFFNAGWWEMVVAEELSKWSGATQILINCELPFRSDASMMKNEIDILLNADNKLVFVECKSGNVVQADINKMNTIKKTYGGVISKAILVSRYLPNSGIIEKCKELDIEVFASTFSRKQPPSFKNLIKQIGKQLKRSSM